MAADVVGHGLRVGEQQELLRLMLELHASAQRADVMAKAAGRQCGRR